MDLVIWLEGALQEAPSGKHRDALLARAQADQTALDEVMNRYRDEMKPLLGTLRTRGMTLTRESWDAYLTDVTAGRDVDAIFGRYATDVAAVVGAARGWKDNDLEIFGTSLPEKTVVLTFDDGPDPTHTPTILNALAEHDVKAVFFQVGENVGVFKDGSLVTTAAASHTMRLLNEGHLLGSHTWSHKNLPKTTDAELDRQLDLADQILEGASGEDVVLFRPPYGGRDSRVFDALKKRNTRAYLWNIDSRDWADPVPESIAQTVYEQVTANGHGVILLHDVHSQTALALPLILKQLQSEGYRFVLWDGETIHGDEPAVASQEAPVVYEDSWAVVVGVNEYDHWPRLSYAVQDARGIRDALVDKLGFASDHVIELFDGKATRERILSVLGDELPAKVGPEDRVFVFFAGHGTTREIRQGSQHGYIVPVDADMEHLASQAISMSLLEDVQESLPAKHVLFVMDACYSGIALTRSGTYTGDPRRYLREVTRRTARQILTAGGADEQVADQGPGGHSIFTWTVLQGLDGPADLNGDGFITASELSGFVGPRVSQLSQQTPAFGNLVGSEGGEFVLSFDQSHALLSDTSSQKLDAAEVARAQQMLMAKEEENQGLMAELARMQEKLLALTQGRGADQDPALQAQRLHQHGLSEYRAGRLTEAHQSLLQASKLDDANAEIVNNLGFLLQELGDHEGALVYLERAMRRRRSPTRGSCRWHPTAGRVHG
jgi:peptidoglycan/xylan/chitin deacetylase (PgdA/CDA1 family)